MQVQRLFKLNIKRDKTPSAEIYRRKFVSEIMKKEYTTNFYQSKARAYNIHYQNVIITSEDLTDLDKKFVNDH